MKPGWLLSILFILIGWKGGGFLDVKGQSAKFSFPSSLYETFITEGKSLRKDFFSVRMKSSGPIKYDMTSLIDSRSQDFFEIDPSNGDISTISKIDREFMDVHYFKVTGAENDGADGGRTATTTLQISVRDINDNAPVFEKKLYNTSVRESLPIGSPIVRIRATDEDYEDNGRVSYFLNGAGGDNLFRIDSTTGVVSLKSHLDREKKAQHVINVIARDNAVPSERLSTNATVIISIEDDNDNVPSFTKRIYYIDVREDMKSGSSSDRTLIGSVRAVDSDVGNNAMIKYSIIGGNTGSAFTIDQNSGNLYLQQSLDREQQDSYKLIVRAQDLGNPPKSNTTQVVINIIDVNDNKPQFSTNSYYQSVAENVPQGYSILQVSAFDPDQGRNSKIEYSLHKTSIRLPFLIEKETGWIKTSKVLDREVAGSYRFNVQAMDQGSPPLSAIANVQISVLDRNDNDPKMSQRVYDIVVSESAPLGSEVLKVVASDPDENSEIRYEIIGGNLGNSFSISSHQGAGKITIAQPLDYNKNKYFKLSIKAIDSGGRFSTSDVNVNITDSNNHAPRFENTPYIFDVFEDAPIGSTVSMLFASDQDHGENAKISYRAIPPSDTFLVERETGALVVNAPLDRESVSTVILTVMAEDGGLTRLSDQTEVQISIMDVNDNAPQFDSSYYEGSVHENSPAGASVAEVSAHDADEGEDGKVRYRFYGRSEDEQSFTVDPVSGVIRTKRPLDRETRDYYEIMIEAYDSGIPEMSSTVKVQIHVLDLNDNPPKFENETLVFNFPENLPAGSKVGTVFVSDPDIGKNQHVSFTMLETGEDSKYFYIDDATSNGNTVSILSRREFDYEVDRRLYQLVLRAESAPLRSDVVVKIKLTDVNDNYPIMKDFDIIFNNRIDEYFSEPIAYVPAEDADPTSRLLYNFTYGNEDKLLELDPRNGAIRLAPPVKSNVNMEAKVGVKVSDGKNEARASLRLRLNYVTDKMLQNSVTLRVKNVTAQGFISTYLSSSFYEYLIEGLSFVIPAPKPNIHIFSIKPDTESREQILNITFSVSGMLDGDRRGYSGGTEETFIDPEYVRQRIYLQHEQLTKVAQLNYLPFDDNVCVQEPCLNFERCKPVLKFSHEDKMLKESTLMFRSVNPLATYSCQCPTGFTGMNTRYECDVQINMCYSSPCKNGATCTSIEGGYFCTCPDNFAGKDCEIDLRGDTCSSSLCHSPSKCVSDKGIQCKMCSENSFNDEFCRLTARSFSPGTYAAFPALRQRYEFNISLEFATQLPDGLIFYNGRLSDENDYISLELTDGGKAILFKFSTGNSLPVQLSLSKEKPFSDGHFHRVEVNYKNETVVISLGGNTCDKRLSLKHIDTLKDEYICANSTTTMKREESFCGFYSGKCTKFLDLTGPLMIGGIPKKHVKSRKFSSESFVGCIRNLQIDREVINMNSYVHNNGSIMGCPEKRDFCASSPCKNDGQCSNGWGSYVCNCSSGWTGKNCARPSGRIFGFDRGSQLEYRQNLSPIQLPWQTSISFKTRTANCTLLSVKMGNNDVYRLDIRDGTIVYLYDNSVLTSAGHVEINDGEWHSVQIKWMEDEVWLNIDYGQYEITKRSLVSIAGKIVTKVTVGDAKNLNKFFKGCLQNVRIGSDENSKMHISVETKIVSCNQVDDSCVVDEKTNKCLEMDTECNGPGCFCPFKKGFEKSCLPPCELGLCSKGSVCKDETSFEKTFFPYTCDCLRVNQTGRYCDPVSKEVCPSHWWGSPVCGPCHCNVSLGFDEACDSVTGECHCKSHHYRSKNANGDDICLPCHCFSDGSVDNFCDATTGQCKCNKGVHGDKCDACSHQFAELTSKGCQPIYGSCPAQYNKNILWPRTEFGQVVNANCSSGAVGIAVRRCTNSTSGWAEPDLSGCLHKEFLVFRNTLFNNSNEVKESWILAKKAYDLITTKFSQIKEGHLFDRDIKTIKRGVYKIFNREEGLSGFRLAHRVDRGFLKNFFSVLNWVFDAHKAFPSAAQNVSDCEKASDNTNQNICLISSVVTYGKGMLASMESTFTNPFEIQMPNIIFGLDTYSSPKARNKRMEVVVSEFENNARKTPLTIPKYDNYMRNHDSWNTVTSQISNLRSDTNYRIQYSVYNLRKQQIERRQLVALNLMWGTEYKMFSNVFSLLVEKDDIKSGREDIVSVNSEYQPFYPNPMEKIVTFKDIVEKPANKLHCVSSLDHQFWSTIDCETEYEEPIYDGQEIEVKCACDGGSDGQSKIFAVLEESVTDGHEYLNNDIDSIVFSVCSSISLAVLLLTAICLTCFNDARKTSITIHRNICLNVFVLHVLVLIVILANTEITSELPLLCKFLTMCLHYFSVCMFVWVMIDSAHIYRMLSEVRDINHGRMTFYSAAGFGIPALVVGLTVGVSGNSYGTVLFCWLSYLHSSIWGMLGPEIVCAISQMVMLLINLKTVFSVKSELDELISLRLVFFISFGILPLVSGFHVSSLVMINERSSASMYAFSAFAIVLAFYILCGFVFCDKSVMQSLAMCSNSKKNKKRHEQGTSTQLTTPSRVSRSALTYRQKSGGVGKMAAGDVRNIDPAEVSLASTTSQSTYPQSSKFRGSSGIVGGHHGSNLDEPDIKYHSSHHISSGSHHPHHHQRSHHGHHDQHYMTNGSDSDSDMDRRSLDLASSHTSDDDYENNVFDPSDLKALSVNDFPQF